jgi:hypothetical protein
MSSHSEVRRLRRRAGFAAFGGPDRMNPDFEICHVICFLIKRYNLYDGLKPDNLLFYQLSPG